MQDFLNYMREAHKKISGRGGSDYEFSSLGPEALFDHIVDAVGLCKDGFTVDDVFQNLDFHFDDDIEGELVEKEVREAIEGLIKDGYLKKDGNVYRFTGDWVVEAVGEYVDYVFKTRDGKVTHTVKAKDSPEGEAHAWSTAKAELDRDGIDIEGLGLYKVVKESITEGVLFNAIDAEDAVNKLKAGLKFPYVNAYYSTLGGEDNVSILVIVSLDPKEEWVNGILENSRYSGFHISNDGDVENFSGSYKLSKLRKFRAKSIDQIISVLNDKVGKIRPKVRERFEEEKAVKTGRLGDQNEAIDTAFLTLSDAKKESDDWAVKESKDRKRAHIQFVATKGNEQNIGKAIEQSKSDIEKDTPFKVIGTFSDGISIEMKDGTELISPCKKLLKGVLSRRFKELGIEGVVIGDITEGKKSFGEYLDEFESWRSGEHKTESLSSFQEFLDQKYSDLDPQESHKLSVRFFKKLKQDKIKRDYMNEKIENPLIDFRFIEGKKTVESGTPEYKALEELGENEDAWVAYLDELAKFGVSIEYDLNTDSFIISNNTGMEVDEKFNALLKCPRCGKNFISIRASLSRRDNKTNICSDCGTLEAFEDVGILPKYSGEKYWGKEEQKNEMKNIKGMEDEVNQWKTKKANLTFLLKVAKKAVKRDDLSKEEKEEYEKEVEMLTGKIKDLDYLINESTINEQPETTGSFEDSKEEEIIPDEIPTPQENPKQPEESQSEEPTTEEEDLLSSFKKQFFGTKDQKMYYIEKKEDKNGTSDIIVEDALETVVWSAKESGLDVSSDNIKQIILQALEDVRLDQVSYDIVVEYDLLNQDEKQEEEEIKHKEKQIAAQNEPTVGPDDLTTSESKISEKIVKVGNKWQVQSHKGRNLGTYDTKEEAVKRLRQVEFFKHKNESNLSEEKALKEIEVSVDGRKYKVVLDVWYSPDEILDFEIDEVVDEYGRIIDVGENNSFKKQFYQAVWDRLGDEDVWEGKEGSKISEEYLIQFKVNDTPEIYKTLDEVVPKFKGLVITKKVKNGVETKEHQVPNQIYLHFTDASGEYVRDLTDDEYQDFVRKVAILNKK